MIDNAFVHEFFQVYGFHCSDTRSPFTYCILHPVYFSPEQVSLRLETLSLKLGESFEYCVCEFFGLFLRCLPSVGS